MECTTLCQPRQKRGMFSSILRVAQLVKNPPPMPRDLGSISGLGRSPGEGNGNPLQYFCLENPTDRGAWQAIARGVAKSWTGLSD